MPIVNGINYNEKMITDEELAVVEAMRLGGRISIRRLFESEKEAVEYVDSIPNVHPVWTFNWPESGIATVTTKNQKLEVIAEYPKKVTPPASNE